MTPEFECGVCLQRTPIDPGRIGQPGSCPVCGCDVRFVPAKSGESPSWSDSFSTVRNIVKRGTSVLAVLLLIWLLVAMCFVSPSELAAGPQPVNDDVAPNLAGHPADRADVAEAAQPGRARWNLDLGEPVDQGPERDDRDPGAFGNFGHLAERERNDHTREAVPGDGAVAKANERPAMAGQPKPLERLPRAAALPPGAFANAEDDAENGGERLGVANDAKAASEPNADPKNPFVVRNPFAKRDEKTDQEPDERRDRQPAGANRPADGNGAKRPGIEIVIDRPIGETAPVPNWPRTVQNVPPGFEIANPDNLPKDGEAVYVAWGGAWFLSTIERVGPGGYDIHYAGWGHNWDETVPPSRVALKVKNE